ncbi:MAG: RluA family pseudouridine synthase [Bacteroides sp.]|nr:RluA family pseudouridine synthase [Bacteroides sp.]
MNIKVTENASLLDVLLRAFPDSNKTHLKKAVRFGCVTFRGAVLRHPDFRLRAGQEITFKKYGDRDTHREKPPFRVLFEDEEIIAVFKPAGILSSGRTTEKVRSMFGAVNRYVLEKSRGNCRAYTVHRLDREVSGILLFAKSERTQEYLQDNWERVEKHYYALVHNVPRKKEATLQSWLKENARQVVYSVPEEEEGAKWSVTHYRIVDTFGWDGGQAPQEQALFSLLRIRLETGRKNQIRVHMSDMGCPIVGDRKYGADTRVKRAVRLFAYSISFPHPLQERRVHLEITPPAKFNWVSQDGDYL